jgi:hypothetical protein
MPVLEVAVASAGSARTGAILEPLLDRAELVLVASSPRIVGGGASRLDQDTATNDDVEELDDSELVVLVRGSLGANALARVGASLSASSGPRGSGARGSGARGSGARGDSPGLRASGTRSIDGHAVWVTEDEEGTTLVAQPRADTLVLAESVEAMRGMLARTRMTPGSPRWPPALRAVVEASRLERATFGLAIADRESEQRSREAPGVSIAGCMDAPGGFDVELLVEAGDPNLAASVAEMLEIALDELAEGERSDFFALARIAELAEVETRGTQVRGSVHASLDEARQLVPGLMGVLRDRMEERAPSLPGAGTLTL